MGGIIHDLGFISVCFLIKPTISVSEFETYGGRIPLLGLEHTTYCRIDLKNECQVHREYQTSTMWRVNLLNIIFFSKVMMNSTIYAVIQQQLKLLEGCGAHGTS